METIAPPEPTTIDLTLPPLDTFPRRHIGPDAASIAAMLDIVGASSLDAFIDDVVPEKIRLRSPLDLPAALGESGALAELKAIASRNEVWKSYLGTGYSDCLTPPVIQRNILENPGWYTSYTPYQAEISQGRMEALLNFQTMIIDLTGLEIANASLLDEGTAVAEAMHLCHSVRNATTNDAIFISDGCHPQTIAVVKSRALPLEIEVVVGDHRHYDFSEKPFAVVVQYPATDGTIFDYAEIAENAHAAGSLVICAADLLALTLLKSPGEFGADVAVGSSQRFGVPLGFGGPHAAYMATRDAYKRSMPGRLIGVSVDSNGNPAMRLSLQTREQHIRRDKATSNICTAQVLLAVIASTYAVWHGPEGLTAIATRVYELTKRLALRLVRLGWNLRSQEFFDTIVVEAGEEKQGIVSRARENRINLRIFPDGGIGISIDETTNEPDIDLLVSIFGKITIGTETFADEASLGIDPHLERTTSFLTHPVFNTHHSETELLRYLKRLENRDLSLTTSMIALGSCTMKLNATAEMFPVTWPEIGKIHPHAPLSQVAGYLEIFRQLESWLAEITGFAAVSLQPNSGAQGEYAGLLAIRSYHLARGDARRKICLIPTSAHGTNPASAVMAGFQVVPVTCDSDGNVNLLDLRQKAAAHAHDLGALMVTYPSTHGVFEEGIVEICEIVHSHGGQVYLDGANLNAQVGICRPGDFGADVCHLNLHKTFCIPHGGGGPGVGPIAVAAHLSEYLPGKEIQVSAAPWGSASINVISWMYIRMMGPDGLTLATKMAILNANYIVRQLEPHFPILYKGRHDYVAHECILDLRGFKATAGVEVEDVAKRLIDYGFHAPTMSWPVAGTLMVEPTESETMEEIDRFCDAMIAIHQEILAIESGALDRANNVLKNAPHTAQCLLSEKWDRPYSRESAAYPSPATREHKFWPHVGRVDNVYGDRNLVCSCLPMESYGEES